MSLFMYFIHLFVVLRILIFFQPLVSELNKTYTVNSENKLTFIFSFYQLNQNVQVFFRSPLS